MLSMDPAILWLGLVILLLIIEIATMGLTTIWFAGGAMVAFFSTFFGASVATQRTIFLVLSLALLVITRPMAVKYMRGGHVNDLCQRKIQNHTSRHLHKEADSLICHIKFSVKHPPEQALSLFQRHMAAADHMFT